jgi:cytochrome c-type biogenesis protein CcsB
MDYLWFVILIGYALCVVESILSFTSNNTTSRRLIIAPLALAFGAHTVWLVHRGITTNRCPLVGTEEMMAFLSWCLVIAYLITYRWFHTGALKTFIFPIVLVATTIAAIAPPAEGSPVGIDNPLQRFLFPLHAGLILLAYSAFFIAFGAGLMYLIQERELKHKRFGKIFFRLPSLDTCDSISFKAMAVGFIMLTLGIVAGIGWQKARDGHYWHGDPMEIFSYATWVIYLLLIQSRRSTGWAGRTAALASIVGFMIVIFSLMGVRFLGTLHPFS